MKNFINILIVSLLVASSLFWRFGVAQADTTITITTSIVAMDAFGYDTTLQYAGQSFKATQAGTISSITTLLGKVGSPSDNVVVSFENDSAGKPSGTAITSGSVAMSGLTTISAGNCVGSTSTFTFGAPVTVTNNTTYWLVYSRSGANDTANRAVTCGQNTDVYANGTAAQGTSLNAWTNNAEDYNIRLTIVSAVAALNFSPFFWIN